MAADGDGGSITLDTAKEVVRLSELYLDGTLKLAIAADARAMQIAGLSSAAATALSIVGFDYIVHPSRIDVSLGVSAFGAGLASTQRCSTRSGQRNPEISTSAETYTRVGPRRNSKVV